MWRHGTNTQFKVWKTPCNQKKGLVASQRPDDTSRISFDVFHDSTFLIIGCWPPVAVNSYSSKLQRLSTGDNSSLLAMRTPSPIRWWKRHPSSASYSDSTLHPPSVEGRLLGAFLPSAFGGRRYPTTETHLHIERAPGPLKPSLQDFYFKVT